MCFVFVALSTSRELCSCQTSNVEIESADLPSALNVEIIKEAWVDFDFRRRDFREVATAISCSDVFSGSAVPYVHTFICACVYFMLYF